MDGSELGIVGRGFGSWYGELGGGGNTRLEGISGGVGEGGEARRPGREFGRIAGTDFDRTRNLLELVGSSSGKDGNGGGRSEVEIGREIRPID